MMSSGDVKLRAVIQFRKALGKTPTQTFNMMKESDKNCSRSLVFKGHGRFKDCRPSIADDERCVSLPVVSSYANLSFELQWLFRI